MKKRVSRLFSLLMTFFLFAGIVACSTPSTKNEAPKKEDNTFVVGFDQNFPPFGYVDEKGNFTGFDIELATEAAKRMNKKIVLQPIEWDAKDMELESGTIDCIWNGFTINGREDKYTWSTPYMSNYQDIVVRLDSGINTFDDLAGKVVDVQKESTALSALEDNPELMNSFGQLNQVADYNTAIMDLESGAIDAIAMDHFVAIDQIKGKDNLIILDDHISEEQYAIGFLLGNDELRDEVELVMKEMMEDGTFEKISMKYFNTNVANKEFITEAKKITTKQEKKQETVKANKGMAMTTIMKQLAGGMGTTIFIFVMTLLFALPLGLLIAFGRMSKNFIISTLFKIYISIMRGTPLMLQMLVIYFGPYYIFGMQISSAYRGIAVIIAFSLNYAAYFAEIYRSGIASMPKGQYEAATVLGYDKVQTFFIIILPQVIKRILPAITNEVITLVKDTSLAFSIAYAEMFTQAKALAAAEKSMIPFVVAAIFYYVFNFLVAALMEHFEKRMNYYE
ncbi:MAG: ABC transporter permease subunit [Erysipelotrichaceae bacterium]|nr:ABC transporter permease subunit [Erysipelotrichaceae bacterium]